MEPQGTPPESGRAMLRGVIGRCPRCGTGRLFHGYLTVAERCGECGEPTGEFRTADAPAFFTICIVGLLLVPLLGFGFAIFRPEPVTLLIWVTAVVLVLALVTLRLVKGAVVGFLWANDERDPGS